KKKIDHAHRQERRGPPRTRDVGIHMIGGISADERTAVVVQTAEGSLRRVALAKAEGLKHVKEHDHQHPSEDHVAKKMLKLSQYDSQHHTAADEDKHVTAHLTEHQQRAYDAQEHRHLKATLRIEGHVNSVNDTKGSDRIFQTQRRPQHQRRKKRTDKP